jgi:Calcineurin-like phosphoesterase
MSSRRLPPSRSSRPHRPVVATTWLAILLLVSCAASSEGRPASSPTPSGRASAAARQPATTRASDVVRIAAAGDIACPGPPHGGSDPDHCQYDETSKLLVHKGLDRILALGDNQYDVGAYQAYLDFYDPWWGRVLRRTSPVPGNHEYAQDPNGTPRGYFRYFGRRVKGPDGLGYYSFDLPKGCTPGHGVCWHLVALSSELCFAPGGCGPAADPGVAGTGNRMYAWLKADLAAHPASKYPCTLAYWHHPLFSISALSGGSTAVRPLWRLLFRAHADVVLNGHSHNYQRWRPMTPGGRRDGRHRIREFIVGTGGASKYPMHSSAPSTLAVAQNRSFGVLVLRLAARGYSWAWRTANGQGSFADAHRAPVKCR